VSIDVGSYTSGLGAEFATSYDTFTITGDKVSIAIAANAGVCPSVISSAIALRVHFQRRSSVRRMRRGKALRC
jgi:hypothetical protein